MRATAAAATVLALVSLAGCSTPDDATVTVLAAASLTEVMEQVAEGFERAHPGVLVRTTYGGSSDLAAQILEGAPADVFASADEAQMDAVAELTAAEPAIFATNTLTLAVPRGNPGGIAALAEAARPDVTTVICAPQVPCGAATIELTREAGVVLSPASEEQSVTDVLGKVASGQADAGIVYRTDIARSDAVEEVPVDGADSVLNRYPVAPLSTAADSALAADFAAYLAGPEARAVLDAAGFGAP